MPIDGRIIRTFATIVYSCYVVAAASAGDNEGGTAGLCISSHGPDVIVGNISGPQNYTGEDGYEVLSLGFELCNIGDAILSCSPYNFEHPLSGGNLFKLKTVNGVTRFEQLGQSWLVAALLPLQNDLCCTCDPRPDEYLGVGCSDPTTAAYAGSQGVRDTPKARAAADFFRPPRTAVTTRSRICSWASGESLRVSK